MFQMGTFLYLHVFWKGYRVLLLSIYWGMCFTCLWSVTSVFILADVFYLSVKRYLCPYIWGCVLPVCEALPLSIYWRMCFACLWSVTSVYIFGDVFYLSVKRYLCPFIWGCVLPVCAALPLSIYLGMCFICLWSVTSVHILVDVFYLSVQPYCGQGILLHVLLFPLSYHSCSTNCVQVYLIDIFRVLAPRTSSHWLTVGCGMLLEDSFTFLLTCRKNCQGLVYITAGVLFLFWQYLMRWLIWHLSPSSSIYYGLIVASRSNPFLGPTSTKQWG